MKKNALTTILLGLLTVSALTSVLLCWLFISNTRKTNVLKDQVGRVINARNLVSALANDAIEYSKKNPAIEPLLESVGYKPGKSAPASTNKPQTK